MSPFHRLLDKVLRYGEVILPERPAFAEEDKPAIIELLRSLFEEHRLEVAGPSLEFDAPTALAAAAFLLQSCWSLVSSNETTETTEKNLQFPFDPKTMEAHLSADLCLRHLSVVYLRVRTRAPDDPLHGAIVDVLRRWPLSGAGVELHEPPLSSTDFNNHFGLQLLFAERLSAALRPSWIPAAGRTREAVELVLQQQGKKLPEPPEREGAE